MICDSPFDLSIGESGILAKIPSDGAKKPHSRLLCMDPENLPIESAMKKIPRRRYNAGFARMTI